MPPDGVSTGELVFNTSMSGYQEVLTDPSYSGQVVCFTYPHVGSYGVTPHDDEADRIWTSRVRRARSAAAGRRTGERAAPLEYMLEAEGVPGSPDRHQDGLTRQVRSKGAIACALRDRRAGRCSNRRQRKSQERPGRTS